MDRRTLHLDFADFWPNFEKTDNWLWHVLSQRFDLVISDRADLLVYSCYGDQHRAHSGVKVFLSHENRGWGFSQCDWAITSDYSRSSRHLRVPLWATMVPSARGRRESGNRLLTDRGFATIVMSNGNSQTRERMHDLLNSHAEVASGGRHRNNVGGPVADKHAFLGLYKFSIAFENSSYPGYTTEKLLHALQADTVPIYWGDPLVGCDFNTKRFVNCHDFADEAAVLQRIIELDQDDDQYLAMLAEPWFRDNVLPECADLTSILDFFDLVANDTSTPVARRRLRPDTVLRTALDRWAIRRRFLSRVT